MSTIIFHFNMPEDPSERVHLLYMQIARAIASIITGEPREKFLTQVINHVAMLSLERERIPRQWIENAEMLIGRLLRDCEWHGEMEEKSQPDAALTFAQARIESLERLATDYYTLLRVVSIGHWQQTMSLFWNDQREKLQIRAEELGITHKEQKT